MANPGSTIHYAAEYTNRKLCLGFGICMRKREVPQFITRNKKNVECKQCLKRLAK